MILLSILLLFYASFKSENLILKLEDSPNENLNFILFYKHENDPNFRDAVLKNVYKNDNSAEYRVEYTIPNVQPGKYICQIQSKCDFGVSEMSTETFVYKNEEEDVTEDSDHDNNLACYNHGNSDAKWKTELKNRKNSLQDHAKQVATELLVKKKKEAGEAIAPDFSDHEIESKFQKFWNSVRDGFESKKNRMFVSENVRQKFFNEIRSRCGHVASIQRISNKFGLCLQNEFQVEWINFSHVVYTGNIIARNYNFHIGISQEEFYESMRELISTTESKLLYHVIDLCHVGGLKKMRFQSDPTIFDCEALVKEYLTKAIDLLVKTHEESQQKNKYTLTDTFKAIFLFKAAQLAAPKFEKVQQSITDYMSISAKLESEKENIKQIFVLTLKKEGSQKQLYN